MSSRAVTFTSTIGKWIANSNWSHMLYLTLVNIYKMAPIKSNCSYISHRVASRTNSEKLRHLNISVFVSSNYVQVSRFHQKVHESSKKMQLSVVQRV